MSLKHVSEEANYKEGDLRLPLRSSGQAWGGWQTSWQRVRPDSGTFKYLLSGRDGLLLLCLLFVGRVVQQNLFVFGDVHALTIFLGHFNNYIQSRVKVMGCN